jgi:hypothetical protein
MPNWTISALLLDARRPGRIILGVEGLGVYVTHDAGSTFTASNEGFSHRQVRELVTDPQQPARMVLVLTNAVESIYATNDSGRTWTAIGHNASTQTLRHVYAAPEPASGWWATPQSGGLLHYDAARATWVQTGVVATKSSAPAARTTKTVARAKTASAASAKNSVAAKAPAAGTSAFSKPLRSQIYDMAFSGNLWLAATSEGLIASRDHGTTWSELDSYSRTSTAPHAAVRFVHISANGQSLWVLGDSGLTISRDSGASWANADPSLRGKDVDKLVIADTNTLFAIRSNGSLISNDGGLTWRSLNLPDAQVADVAVEGNEWLISTRKHGLFVSANKGQSWKQLNGQLGEGSFSTLAAGPSSRMVFAASSTEGLFSLRVPLTGSSAALQTMPGGNQQQ